MARYYVEKDGEWNIFSTVIDDFLLDEFICLDALKARLLYERFKELTEDMDSLLTDRPKVNVMPYEEAMELRRKDEPQTHDICTNTHECVKDTHDKTESSSEKPNNCEHITEDGVTCAKYPACDDCLDNPLNKVKGSERLVKGSEKPNNLSENPTGSERAEKYPYNCNWDE